MRTRIVAATLYSPLAFVFAKAHGIPGLLSDYLFGIATFAFLWVMLSATNRARQNTPFIRISRSLARASYTLYVVHVPFLILLTALLLGERRWVPDAQHILKGLGILAVTFLYAYLVASLTEFHTDSVRHWVEAKLGLAKKPAREKKPAQDRKPSIV
jgi:peptidoglycan/LPS O-acetylase OafA/YrhL